MSRDSQKWTDLEANLRADPTFVAAGNRLDYRVLRSLFHARRAVIRETREVYGPRTIYGYVARRPTKVAQWAEVSTAWVAPEKAGNGILGEMLGELIAEKPEGSKLFAFSSSQSFIAAACRHYFFVVDSAAQAGFDILECANNLGIRHRLPVKLGGADENPNRHLLIRL